MRLGLEFLMLRGHGMCFIFQTSFFCMFSSTVKTIGILNSYNKSTQELKVSHKLDWKLEIGNIVLSIRPLHELVMTNHLSGKLGLVIYSLIAARAL